jgi:NADH:ubiquinone oxidoreductase subunit 6 (subunit J)
MDLIHYLKDDTLFFAEKTFSSENLTRSADLLFLTMCLAAIIAAYQRRSFLHAVLVVICGGVTVASLTLIRAVTVLWLWNRYSVDLAMGPAGIATDVFLVVIAVACLVSADAFLNVLSAFVPDFKRMGPVELFWNPFIYLWNRWVASAMPNPFPSETPVVSLFPGATAVFAVILVISLMGQIADLLLKRVI